MLKMKIVIVMMMEMVNVMMMMSVRCGLTLRTKVRNRLRYIAGAETQCTTDCPTETPPHPFPVAWDGSCLLPQ